MSHIPPISTSPSIRISISHISPDPHTPNFHPSNILQIRSIPEEAHISPICWIQVFHTAIEIHQIRVFPVAICHRFSCFCGMNGFVRFRVPPRWDFVFLLADSRCYVGKKKFFGNLLMAERVAETKKNLNNWKKAKNWEIWKIPKLEIFHPHFPNSKIPNSFQFWKPTHGNPPHGFPNSNKNSSNPYIPRYICPNLLFPMDSPIDSSDSMPPPPRGFETSCEKKKKKRF